MASKRIEMFNSEIQRELSSILQSVKDPNINGIISVQNVELTRDFSHCNVYVSIYNSKDNKATFNALKNAIPYIRRQLASRVDIRTMPELHLFLDESLDYVQKINQVLKNL